MKWSGAQIAGWLARTYVDDVETHVLRRPVEPAGVLSLMPAMPGMQPEGAERFMDIVQGPAADAEDSQEVAPANAVSDQCGVRALDNTKAQGAEIRL